MWIVLVAMTSCPPCGMASRVDHEIEDHLLHHAGIGLDEWLAVVLAFQADIFADDPGEHLEEIADHVLFTFSFSGRIACLRAKASS